jgi:hypothetical protein
MTTLYEAIKARATELALSEHAIFVPDDAGTRIDEIHRVLKKARAQVQMPWADNLSCLDGAVGWIRADQRFTQADLDRAVAELDRELPATWQWPDELPFTDAEIAQGERELDYEDAQEHWKDARIALDKAEAKLRRMGETPPMFGVIE